MGEALLGFLCGLIITSGVYQHVNREYVETKSFLNIAEHVCSDHGGPSHWNLNGLITCKNGVVINVSNSTTPEL